MCPSHRGLGMERMLLKVECNYTLQSEDGSEIQRETEMLAGSPQCQLTVIEMMLELL